MKSNLVGAEEALEESRDCLDPDKQNHICCQQGLGKHLSPRPDRHVRKIQDKKGREKKKNFSL